MLSCESVSREDFHSHVSRYYNSNNPYNSDKTKDLESNINNLKKHFGPLFCMKRCYILYNRDRL